MASDGNPGKIPATSLVHGSQASITVSTQSTGGKPLPPGGTNAARAAPVSASPKTAPGTPKTARADSAAGASKPAAPRTDPQSLVDLLNKHLNDSGRADQFRIDPASDDTLIQQINPATGEVVGEFLISEFPALARSIGASGLIVDDRA